MQKESELLTGLINNANDSTGYTIVHNGVTYIYKCAVISFTKCLVNLFDKYVVNTGSVEKGHQIMLDRLTIMTTLMEDGIKTLEKYKIEKDKKEIEKNPNYQPTSLNLIELTPDWQGTKPVPDAKGNGGFEPGILYKKDIIEIRNTGTVVLNEIKNSYTNPNHAIGNKIYYLMYQIFSINDYTTLPNEYHSYKAVLFAAYMFGVNLIILSESVLQERDNAPIYTESLIPTSIKHIDPSFQRIDDQFNTYRDYTCVLFKSSGHFNHNLNYDFKNILLVVNKLIINIIISSSTDYPTCIRVNEHITNNNLIKTFCPGGAKNFNDGISSTNLVINIYKHINTISEKPIIYYYCVCGEKHNILLYKCPKNKSSYKIGSIVCEDLSGVKITPLINGKCSNCQNDINHPNHSRKTFYKEISTGLSEYKQYICGLCKREINKKYGKDSCLCEFEGELLWRCSNCCATNTHKNIQCSYCNNTINDSPEDKYTAIRTAIQLPKIGWIFDDLDVSLFIKHMKSKHKDKHGKAEADNYNNIINKYKKAMIGNPGLYYLPPKDDNDRVTSFEPVDQYWYFINPDNWELKNQPKFDDDRKQIISIYNQIKPQLKTTNEIFKNYIERCEQLTKSITPYEMKMNVQLITLLVEIIKTHYKISPAPAPAPASASASANPLDDYKKEIDEFKRMIVDQVNQPKNMLHHMICSLKPDSTYVNKFKVLCKNKTDANQFIDLGFLVYYVADKTKSFYTTTNGTNTFASKAVYKLEYQP